MWINGDQLYYPIFKTSTPPSWIDLLTNSDTDGDSVSTVLYLVKKLFPRLNQTSKLFMNTELTKQCKPNMT